MINAAGMLCAADGQPIVSDSFHMVSDNGEMRRVHILVTADEFCGLPADLGMKIADLIRKEWPCPTPGSARSASPGSPRP